jgi:hypothetical protein
MIMLKSNMSGGGIQGETRDNPPVHSKFDRSHGHGLKPPHATLGGMAPMSGTKVPGHTESGHRLPTEIHKKTTDSITSAPKRVL